MNTMSLSDSLLCIADHFAFWTYRSRYHYSTTFRGMFMDTTRPPDLPYMTFFTCCRHDTGEADASILLFPASVSVFIHSPRIRPSQFVLTVLYFVRFRCSLCFCRMDNFKPLITEAHVSFANGINR